MIYDWREKYDREAEERRRGCTGSRIKQIARIRRADRMAKTDGERVKVTLNRRANSSLILKREGADMGRAKLASDDAAQRNGEE